MQTVLDIRINLISSGLIPDERGDIRDSFVRVDLLHQQAQSTKVTSKVVLGHGHSSTLILNNLCPAG